jgi:enterochelin esterase-like enzyme
VSLLGTKLLLMLAVLSVAAVVAMVLLWPRLARTAVWTVLGRLGLITLVNALVLLLALALVNHQFQFFGDWSDLIGATSSQGTTAAVATVAGGSPRSAVVAPVAPQQAAPPASTSVVIARDATSTTYAVTGGSSKITSEVQVFLPNGYADAVNASHRYPVLEGFGGYPSVVTSTAKAYDLAAQLTSLTDQHLLAPTIAVMVQPWTPPGRDTECANGPGGASAADQVETYVSVDVPAWVRSTFRSRADRGSWATWGPSAGAWCAAVAAMLHPDTFGAFISIGGYCRVEWGNWQPYAAGDPRAARYDLVALAGTNPPPVAAWIYTSKQDSQSAPSTLPFIAAAHAPLAVSAHVAETGGHRTPLWKPWLPVALTWLGSVSPGFSPTVRP